MPTVDELLNVEPFAETGDAHEQEIYCVIHPDSRTIEVPEEYQLLGVVGDKKVERLWFQCSKVVGDNKDISDGYVLFINYRNANGDPDAYRIKDMEIEGENITFSWELEEKVTAYQGTVDFSFRAIRPETDSENKWNTTINNDCNVLVGLQANEQITKSEPDALAQIWAAIDELKAGGTVDPEQIKQAVNGYLEENPVQPTPIDSSLTKEGEAADAKKTGDELNKRLIAPADNGTEGQVLSKDADGNNIWKDYELKDKSVTMNKTDFLSAKEAFNFIEQYRDTFNSWNYNTFPLLDTMPKDNVEFWVVTTENVQNDTGVQCVIYYESYGNVNTTPVEKTQITVDDTTYYIRHWKFSYNHNVCVRWGFGNNVRLDTSQIVYWTDTPVDEEFLRNNGKTYSSNADFKKIVSDITNEQMEGIKKEVLDSANDEIAGMAIKINPIYGKHIWMIGDSNTQYNLSGIQSLFEDEYGCTFTSYATAGYPWGTENGENTTDNSAVGQINRICSQAENLESEAFSEDSHIFLFMMGTNATSGGNGSESTADDVSTCYGAMNYCFRKISRYARVGNAVGVIIPLEINTTDKENQIALCKKYAIPYIDLMTEARIYQDNGVNYITDGGNHMAGNGMLHWKRIVGKWVAYRI